MRRKRLEPPTGKTFRKELRLNEACIVASYSTVLPEGTACAIVSTDGARIVRIETFATERALDEEFLRRKDTHREAGTSGSPAPSARFVDARAHIVAPSFVNAHTHLAMNLFRAFPTRAGAAGNLVEDVFFRAESHLTREDVRAFARVGALECLASGTGFVWDHYYHADAVAMALRDTGLCGVVAPTLQDLGGPGKDDMETALELTFTLHGDERWESCGVFAALGPHATDTVSAALWKRIADEAQSRALPIHSHIAQSPEEFERVVAREGLTPCEFVARSGVFNTGTSFLAVHGIYLRNSDMALMQRARDAVLVFCPYSQLIFHFPADASAWTRHGLAWCVATDCAASNDSMAVQKELRYVAGLDSIAWSRSNDVKAFAGEKSRVRSAAVASRIRRGRQARNAVVHSDESLLEKITTLPGRLHPRVRTGTLAEGALASLCLWRKDAPSLWPATDPVRALVWGDAGDALEGVLSAGRWVFEPGASVSETLRTSSDVREMTREAHERLAALASRAGLAFSPTPR